MSLFRNAVWFVKGMREYTKSGFEKAKKSFKSEDIAEGKDLLKNLSFMITGANSGIGKIAALEIAKRGGTVHMVCRSKERGEAALNEIKERAQNESAEVHLHLLDMSHPRDVATFAADFVKAKHQLHVLINNAGCMVNTRTEEDGLEKNFATNTLGTHLLTVGLLPALKQASGMKPRVILVSSGGMLVMKLDTSDLQFRNLKPFDGTFAYAQNKRQQVIMTEMYAREHPEVHFSVMHPGWADTPAVQQSMPDFHAKMKDKLRSPEQGADTVVWLAVSPAAERQPSGLFFQDRAPVATHLPLAWTKSSDGDKQKLMDELKKYEAQFAPDSASYN